jgi:hypothetical protein
VVGDVTELGNWQEKKLMKKVHRKAGIGAIGKKENLGSTSSQSSEMEYYSFSFYTYRNKEQFYYYYIRKGSVIQSERRPGRVFLFNNQKITHPYRRRVSHPRGEISVVD